MKAQVIKTNNDHFWTKKKIDLRSKYIPNNSSVLECYGGNGVLYRDISKIKNLTIHSIDVKNYERVNLKGDNLKWLFSINIHKYSAIDLDSYGFAEKQLDYLISEKYTGHVFLTCIASGMGNIPDLILQKLGYTKAMTKKSRTLFSKNMFDKIKKYLANIGINEINYYGDSRKYYIHFELK